MASKTATRKTTGTFDPMTVQAYRHAGNLFCLDCGTDLGLRTASKVKFLTADGVPDGTICTFCRLPVKVAPIAGGASVQDDPIRQRAAAHEAGDHYPLDEHADPACTFCIIEAEQAVQREWAEAHINTHLDGEEIRGMSDARLTELLDNEAHARQDAILAGNHLAGAGCAGTISILSAERDRRREAAAATRKPLAENRYGLYRGIDDAFGDVMFSILDLQDFGSWEPEADGYEPPFPTPAAELEAMKTRRCPDCGELEGMGYVCGDPQAVNPTECACYGCGRNLPEGIELMAPRPGTKAAAAPEQPKAPRQRHAKAEQSQAVTPEPAAAKAPRQPKADRFAGHVVPDQAKGAIDTPKGTCDVCLGQCNSRTCEPCWNAYKAGTGPTPPRLVK